MTVGIYKIFHKQLLREVAKIKYAGAESQGQEANFQLLPDFPLTSQEAVEEFNSLLQTNAEACHAYVILFLPTQAENKDKSFINYEQIFTEGENKKNWRKK